MRHVFLYQGEDGYWVAEVPSLPGCITQGVTRDEALKNAAEAVEAWIEAAKSFNEAVPTDPMSAEIRTIATDAA
jgi:predicted RNase H-like HicB family nuclease